jgi:hypothetical protein
MPLGSDAVRAFENSSSTGAPGFEGLERPCVLGVDGATASSDEGAENRCSMACDPLLDVRIVGLNPQYYSREYCFEEITAIPWRRSFHSSTKNGNCPRANS